MDNLSIYIDYDIKNWNNYINAERSNKYIASKIKKEEKEYISWSVCGKEYKGKYPVCLHFKAYFNSKRKDLDNFRLKGLIDGLVAGGVIKNDNLNNVTKIIIEPIFDAEKKGVIVEISPDE